MTAALTKLSDSVNKSQTKKETHLWSKSTKDLTPCNNGFEKEDKLKKGKALSDSTLSLHIEAYENSNEDNLCIVTKEDLKKKGLIKKGLNAKQIAFDSTAVVQNPLEFPRQQENSETINPEIAQYKASQRLINSNLQTHQTHVQKPLPRNSDGQSVKIRNFKAKANDIQRLKNVIIEKIEVQNEVYGWIALIAAFLAIQAVVSAGNYSGYSNGPKFGDFEAQRHWMEITYHLPVSQWYVHSADNDLSYWGLDYPPLTAYHSFIHGKIANALNPSWVELHKSRGIQTPSHLAFMRTTVISTMLLLYAPALILTLRGFLPKNINIFDTFVIGLTALLYPGLIYIDNAHFQYNHIALGLFIWAIYCFQKRKMLWGSFLFVLALNFKQMELYHSLPIFVYLLSISCSSSSPSISTRITKTLCNLSKLGIVVISTFILLWLPFFQNTELFKQVLRRIFPFERGIFEDKVANFWCSLDVLYKYKNHLSIESLIQISLLFVLGSALPSLFILFKKPNDKNFRLSLTITSLSFFMFSYHVHEKTILQCAIPALFLLPDYYEAVTIFLDASSISMFALCIKDEIPEILFMFLIYHIVVRILGNIRSRKLQLLKSAQISISLAICGLQLFGVPPKRYPYLFELLNAVFSFGIFALFWLYLNYSMITGYFSSQRQNPQQQQQQQSSQKKKKLQ